MKEFFNIGQIVNSHGIKGEVKVFPLTDDVMRFKKLKSILIGDIEYKIESCKFQKDRVILKLEGVEDMNAALKLKTKYLKVPRKDAVKLPEDTYFIADLIGCNVYDTNDALIGKIYDVIKTGSNDVYWIKEPKEVLIPVLKEIVLDINIEESKIVIKPVGEWQDED
ncbi:ribosome maturation factor RimM [Clostridium sp. 'White wine YQ']|uniref:ribosome maturation factor RimM n=1 Tax=Clostridium sp. 'White wine YQ' TaxID=3027474 RepID=UPI0023671FAE|nr:ribosome maturation factor RimM [Clostridium sp. 'White wine YQ']MDD7793772.1 ribosome maturation factor RimM [Clostridium sp. 'White wine YQ']